MSRSSMTEYKTDTGGFLHCEDGPALIRENGSHEWYRHGSLHRENGPAYTGYNGDEEWWVKNCLHRIDGPAATNSGIKGWFVNGVSHHSNEAFQDAAGLTEEEMFAIIIKHGNVS